MIRPSPGLFLAVILAVPISANAQSFFTDCISGTGSDATIMIDASGSHVVGAGTFQSGDEIGIFTEDGQCVGADVWTGSNIAIAVWGDDPIQPDKSGLLPDESFMVRVWDKSANQLYGTSYGKVTYNMSGESPFIAAKTYVKNGLYMTDKIEAVEQTARGKNKVRVKGRKPKATESGVDNGGMLSISRTGPFNEGLEVTFALTGDAINGTDFEALATQVVFEPGQKTSYVIIRPIEDGIAEGTETVTLTLSARPSYDLVPDSIAASVTIEDGGSSLGIGDEPRGSQFVLAAPYPNPFDTRTALGFETDQTQRLQVDLYNLIGKKVAAIFAGTVQAGVTYQFLVDAADLPNGMYMVKASGKQTSVRSIVLRR